MIHVEITHAMLLSATVRAYEMGELKDSYTAGNRNIVGCLGEEIFKYYRPKSTQVDDFQCDFLSQGKKVDVKTRLVSCEPILKWAFNIPYRLNQDVDYYLFCCVHKNFKEGWVMGYLSKGEFIQRRQIVRKGDPIPESNGRYLRDFSVVLMRDIRAT